MDFWGAIKSGFINYATFSGRATRSEYWYWTLFIVLGTFAMAILDAAMFSNWPAISPLESVFSLLTILPSLAVWVRRLHDLDARGWWVLVWFIPLFGWIALIAVFCTLGTTGDNRFGPDRLKEISLRLEARARVRRGA